MTVIQKGKIALQKTSSKVSLKTLAKPLAQYCDTEDGESF